MDALEEMIGNLIKDGYEVCIKPVNVMDHSLEETVIGFSVSTHKCTKMYAKSEQPTFAYALEDVYMSTPETT